MRTGPGPAWEVFAPSRVRSRELFHQALIKAHLDHLPGAQPDGGGWTFNWLAWSPAAEREWRGFLTVDALRILRANGRWTGLIALIRALADPVIGSLQA